MLEGFIETVASLDWRMAAGYAALFAVATVMPGWRLLTGCLLVLGFLLGTAFAYFSARDAAGGAETENTVALAFVFFSGAGLIAGAVTRLLSLALRRAGVSWKMRTALTLIGFLAPPAYAVASLSARTW